jgi:hypothetical protein
LRNFSKNRGQPKDLGYNVGEEQGNEETRGRGNKAGQKFGGSVMIYEM